MIGVVGAAVAVAVVLAIVLVLTVRPPAQRFARAAAALRWDLDARLERLRALRRARPPRRPGAGPGRRAGGRGGRHRRVGQAP